MDVGKSRGKGIESFVLEILKRKGGFVSGQDISERLGVTRAAVWKHVCSLRKAGYEIKSTTNKGYKLVGTPDLLSADEISEGLKTVLIGRDVVYFDSTSSTNDRAKEIAASGAREGTVVAAGRQTEGRGRFGKKWLSDSDGGIYASVILRPEAPAADIARITLIAGLAVCAAIRSITLADAGIKWPNDIVINGRKVCGILAEMSAEAEHIDYLVVGIGINVNDESFADEISDRATSLHIETGERISRKTILHGVLANLEKYYLRYLNDPDGAKSVLEEYRKYCVTIDSNISAEWHGGRIEGKACDISDTGGLVIQTSGGEMITVYSGEVSVRGVLGYV